MPRSLRPRALAIAALICLATPFGVARAQEAPAGDVIDDEVAAALYVRGKELYSQGNLEGAKKLLGESLERSPNGPSAPEARELLSRVEADIAAGTGQEPLDPYGDGEEKKPPVAAVGAPPERIGNHPGHPLSHLMFWGGTFGVTAGLAIAGPEDSEGFVEGGTVLAGLVGAGAGAGLSYLWQRFRPVTAGQAAAIASAGFWGTYSAALLGDAATGRRDSTANEVVRFAAVGNAVMSGAGVFYALSFEPTRDDVAMINSAGLYGTTAGFLLGAAMAPNEGEAYSINAFVGALVGIAGGILAAPRLELSRRRTLALDAGAAIGAAAPWILLYPLIEKGSSSGDEQLAGGLAIATMAGGIVGAYLLTDDDDRSSDSSEPATALIHRQSDGAWQLGAPLPRPLTPTAGASGTGSGLIVEVAGGRF